MATNEFLPFADTASGTDILTQSAYNADAQRSTGNISGVARRALVNKALKQSTKLTAAVAQFMADNQGTAIVDTLTPSAISGLLGTALTNYIGVSGGGGSGDIVYVNSVAVIRALTDTTYKNVITLGYWAPGDGGHGEYRYDPSDTTSADNGGTVIVDAGGNRRKLVHDYVVDVAQFGACTGTNDTVYLNAAITWASSVLSTVAGAGGHIDRVMLTSQRTCYITSTIIHPGGKGLMLYLLGGLTATAWVGLTTDPILSLKGNDTNHELGLLECSTLCSGLEFSGYDCDITFEEIRHFVEFGCHQLAGNGGDCDITGILSQWVKTDTEFLNKANFTAKGFWVEGADASYQSCAASWCLYPLYIDTTAISNRFINCHYYQGSGGTGTPPTDPVIIVNNSSNVNFMYNCYYDNGYIYYLKHALVIQGGMYIENALTSITEPWIRVFNATDGVSPFPLRISNLRASVGFYNGAPGVGTFPGDYTTINAIASDAIKGNASFVTRQDVIVCPNSGTTPVKVHLKPIDNWIETYKVGAGQLVTWEYSTTGTILRSSDGLQVFNPTLTGTGAWIGEYNANCIGFKTSAGHHWDIVNAGHFNPIADATLDIGSTANSRRVKNLHARNTILSPTTAENSATNHTMWFEWVDNTHIKLEARGDDGILRSVTFTLA